MGTQRFEFGENWSDFVKKNFSQERVDVSKKHLLEFLGVNDLRGKTFLDIGCGSGLHSLAAFQAGAQKIISFDFDPKSVETTKVLHAMNGAPNHWHICQGSALDRSFMEQIEPADIVYSWGVLHHTGEVWNAISNAASRVAEGGLFYIAIYSADVQKNPPPEYWLALKQDYVKAAPLRRRLMEIAYIWRFALYRNPLNVFSWAKQIIAYRKSRARGMSYMTDVRDWLGGWPMEFCYDKDVTDFVMQRHHMEQEKISAGEANTEFLFRRKSLGAT